MSLTRSTEKQEMNRPRGLKVVAGAVVAVATSAMVALGAVWLAGGIPSTEGFPTGQMGGAEPVDTQLGEVSGLTAAGQAAFAEGDFAQAQGLFLQAAQLEPENPWLAYNLGTVAGALGDLEGAVGFYRRALSLSPSLTPAQYNLGFTLAALGDSDGAAAAYRKVIEMEPANASALWNLGLLLFNQGSITEGQDLMRRAVVLDESFLLRLPESVTLQ